jgi:hypothetical protein
MKFFSINCGIYCLMCKPNDMKQLIIWYETINNLMCKPNDMKQYKEIFHYSQTIMNPQIYERGYC